MGSLWCVACTLTQFLNVVLVIAALSVYVWRQVHQTRKFHGMLYRRVHGRTQAQARRARDGLRN